MNIKEYISSGIVESYVLGLASAQERIEFEKLCNQYPELLAARDEFERKLEKQAFQRGIVPPSNVKEKLLTAIRNEEAGTGEAKVIEMNTRPGSNGLLKFVAAASIILLLGSAWFAYDFYSKNQQLTGTNSQLRAQVDSINQLNEQLLAEKRSTINPNAAVVVSMTGTLPSSSSANVYWDTASSNVFLVVKNLPKLPTEKQFQLWAFIEGKPVDLGLFDTDNKNVILQMKNTQKAEAFAITIENRGNGPTPQGPVETYGKPGI